MSKNRKKEESEVTVSFGTDGNMSKPIALNEAIDRMKEISNGQDPNHKIHIKKAKITSDGCLSIEYDETIILISGDGTKRKDIENTISKTGHNMVHEDLRNAFHKLDIHLALIAEMLKGWSGRDIEAWIEGKTSFGENQIAEIGKFRVTGFSINAADEGVTLIGQKELSTGKVLNLVTPFEKWDGEYDHISELAEAIESCKHEVKEYLGGKMAPPAQTEMEFEEEKEVEQETAGE